MAEPKGEPKEEVRFFVRIANTDLDGKKALVQALTKIKGIGPSYANMVCTVADLDRDMKAGKLTDTQVSKIEEVIFNPLKFHVPPFLLNRRHDYETGEDKHLLMADMEYQKGNDIKRLKMIKSYRGMRHAFGLPTRGQRTKSNFRRNKGKVKIAIKRSSKSSGRV